MVFLFETLRSTVPKIPTHRQHLIEDLRPYTCIAESCPTPFHLFATRKEWETHVENEHDCSKWQCPFCDEDDDQIFSTTEGIESHIHADHQEELSRNSLDEILSWSSSKRMGINSCPLCSSCGAEDAPDLVDHVLRHTYDFSLRALPWPPRLLDTLNKPVGTYAFPEDRESAKRLQVWIKGISPDTRKHLQLSHFDTAIHSEAWPDEGCPDTSYLEEHGYFDDNSVDDSSKPQVAQSQHSIRSDDTDSSESSSPDVGLGVQADPKPSNAQSIASAFTTSTTAALPSPDSEFVDLSHANEVDARSVVNTCYKALREGLRICKITMQNYVLPGLVENVITIETTKAMLAIPQQQSWARIRRAISRYLLPRDSNRDREFDNAILRARKVIAILVLIEKEHAIPDLLGDGITDQDLPLVLKRDPGGGSHFTCHYGKKLFESLSTWSHQALDRFQRSQYLFLVPDVDIPFDTSDPVYDIELHPGCGLPFSCEPAGDGTQYGYSDVYKAWLEHAKPRLSQARPFAIKKFFKKEYFDLERQNLDNLRRQNIKNPHLIQYLAACKLVPCIIFPWADGGDLKHFWEKYEPKTAQGLLQPVLLSWSLRQILGLALAVRDLHYINCRHGDIKPGNILHFPDEDGSLGILKLADFGCAKFHVHATFQRNGGTSTHAATLVYEAPEAEDPISINQPRSRAYDLWSLGCIITEFAHWHLNGNEGLKAFEIERYPREHRFYKRINPEDGQPSIVSVHPAVDNMIENLNNHELYRGSVLEKVVRLARENLLVIEPYHRMKADDLCERLEEIIEGMD